MIGGDDFKSGQTKMKSVLVDFLVGAGIKPTAIVSYNHLGNNDGMNLSAPQTFRSKEISKSNVVDDMVASNSILYAPGMPFKYYFPMEKGDLQYFIVRPLQACTCASFNPKWHKVLSSTVTLFNHHNQAVLVGKLPSNQQSACPVQWRLCVETILFGNFLSGFPKLGESISELCHSCHATPHSFSSSCLSWSHIVWCTGYMRYRLFSMTPGLHVLKWRC